MPSECPECEGTGTVEVMIALTYNGDQTWRKEECPTCRGAGWVEQDDIDEDENV